MRIRLHLTLVNGRHLDFNYQYYIGSWLYYKIAEADRQLASQLHQEGFRTGKKIFKLHCFGRILTSFKTEHQKMLLTSTQASLDVSFYMDNVAEKFVTGIFQNQLLEIGKKEEKVEYFINTVEVLPPQKINETAEIVLQTPVVISKKNPVTGHDLYLKPGDEDYENIFIKNLIDKYLAINKKYNPQWQQDTIKLTIENPEKSKSHLIRIKNGKNATQVKGYTYTFRLTAPTELISIGMLGGFGKHNAMGFGFGNIK